MTKSDQETLRSAVPSADEVAGGSPLPATLAQRTYILHLLQRRGIAPFGAAAYLRDFFGVDNLTTLSRARASGLINELKTKGRSTELLAHSKGDRHDEGDTERV